MTIEGIFLQEGNPWNEKPQAGLTWVKEGREKKIKVSRKKRTSQKAKV